MKKRIIIGITGASGVIYGVRLLQFFKKSNFEVHLVISEFAEKLISKELSKNIDEVKNMADFVYNNNCLEAPISSGSFKTEGMVIAPCSIKTLSGIANSFNTNLLIRAADVCLKERRKLVLVVRETPLNLTHIELMKKVTENGGIILPPVPSFYHMPKTIDDIVNHTIGKIIDQFNINHNLYKRWGSN